MGSNIVEDYWLGVLKRLQAEVDVFNRLITHSGEKGTQNELSFARIVENLIPQRFGVGSGLLIDSKGSSSSQTDIIVFDRADEPAILAQTNQVLFPVENVRACIEVKTTVTGGEITDASEKVASVRRLSPTSGETPPYAMLGYGAQALPKTLATHLRRLEERDRPDVVCFLKAGLVAGRARFLRPDGGDDYVIGLAQLHNSGESGRVAGDYVPAPGKFDEAWLTKAGTSYPIVRNGGENVVVEPSRALLLFCDALLRALGQQRDSSVLSAYIPEIARELSSIEEA